MDKRELYQLILYLGREREMPLNGSQLLTANHNDNALRYHNHVSQCKPRVVIQE